MFQLANRACHDFHVALTRNEPPPTAEEPKPRAPTSHGLVPTFSLAPATPRALPHYGATTRHINRLDKLRRQCSELRFSATHHPHETRSPDPAHPIQQRDAYTWAASQALATRLRPYLERPHPSTG